MTIRDLKEGFALIGVSFTIDSEKVTIGFKGVTMTVELTLSESDIETALFFLNLNLNNWYKLIKEALAEDYIRKSKLGDFVYNGVEMPTIGDVINEAYRIAKHKKKEAMSFFKSYASYLQKYNDCSFNEGLKIGIQNITYIPFFDNKKRLDTVIGTYIPLYEAMKGGES